jgi:hypothetical protein
MADTNKREGRAMKKVAILVADDGDVKLTVRIELVRKGRLVEHEAERVLSQAVRETARGLSSLPYTDYGIDNIEISK